MKVWGISLIARPSWPTTSRQPRAVVAATSRAAAVRAYQQISTSITDGYVKQYGGETANPAEVEAALSEPGTVFIADADGGRASYVPIRPATSH